MRNHQAKNLFAQNITSDIYHSTFHANRKNTFAPHSTDFLRNGFYLHSIVWRRVWSVTTIIQTPSRIWNHVTWQQLARVPGGVFSLFNFQLQKCINIHIVKHSWDGRHKRNFHRNGKFVCRHLNIKQHNNCEKRWRRVNWLAELLWVTELEEVVCGWVKWEKERGVSNEGGS